MKCFKIEKMRETVIILKIQFMLKYRIVHSRYSVACLIFSGVFALPKGVEQSPFVLGKEHISLFLRSGNFNCNYNEKISYLFNISNFVLADAF